MRTLVRSSSQFPPIMLQNAAWSPDGKRLVAEGWGGVSDNGLYILNIETGDVRLVATGSGADYNLRWDDNETISFDVGSGGL